MLPVYLLRGAQCRNSRNRVCGFLLTTLTLISLRAAGLQPTPAPAGPYHVSSNRILDRDGRPYVLRGTGLATVTLDAARLGDLGALSASALVTIRQRLNMNAVRLPLIVADYERYPTYRSRVEQIVRTANRLDLVVILAPSRSRRVPWEPHGRGSHP